MRLKKENQAIKYRIIWDNRNLFEHEEQFYKAVRVGNFWSDNYNEYKSNGDRNKTLSVEEYLDKIRPYLKDIINDLKKSDTCKIQLTIPINSMSSKDNDEERVIHSKSDNIETMFNNKADKVIEEPFQSLLSLKTIFPKSRNIMENSKRPSKYHLSMNFLAQRKTVFPISKKFKTGTFQ